MTAAGTRYIQLATELLLLRELNGGPLSDDVESSYIEQFDRCWQAMSFTEQQEAEQIVAQVALDAPEDLKRQDEVVEPGHRTHPRSGAAGTAA